MTPDIFRVLIQSELSNLPVTCTQMIAATDFVSRPYGIMFKPLEKLVIYPLDNSKEKLGMTVEMLLIYLLGNPNSISV